MSAAAAAPAEEWRTVKEFPRYAVSSFGRVKNQRTGRILKQASLIKKNKTYYRVTFSADAIPQHYSVHRLVAEAFLPNPANKPQVDHINRKTTDNRVQNLRWATQSENQANIGITSRNTSGYPGVYYHGPSKKWMAYIRAEGRMQYLGTYDDVEEAYHVRCAAASFHWGKFAADHALESSDESDSEAPPMPPVGTPVKLTPDISGIPAQEPCHF